MADVTVLWCRRLWFAPGRPVRAASAVTRLRDRWLVAQDDANHAASWSPHTGVIEPVRLFPTTEGIDLFSEASGTKQLKPDLEAACTIDVDGEEAALLLGSGSLPARTRAALVRDTGRGIDVFTADLRGLYDRVADALGLGPGELNLEGACVLEDTLRWFQRGHGGSGVASASVDVELRALVAAVRGTEDPAGVELSSVRRYELGDLGGFPLAITDAVELPDGRICVSVTAEDAPDAVADGPVAGSALALVGDGSDELQLLPLSEPLASHKVEGIAVRKMGARDVVELLAVADDDDPEVGSLAIGLALSLAPRSPGW